MSHLTNSFSQKKLIWVGSESVLIRKKIALSIFQIHPSMDSFIESRCSSNEIFCLFFFCDSLSFFLSLGESIKLLKNENSKFEKVLIIHDMDLMKNSHLIRQAINLREIDNIVNLDDEEFRLEYYIDKVQKNREDSSTREQFLKKSHMVLRQLDALNFSLEKIIEERTRGIAQSKKEEEEKLKKERDIIKFIKQMNICQSLEDLLFYFREELKKIHGINEILLIHKTSNQYFDLYYFLNRQIFKKSFALKDIFKTSNDKVVDSYLLANIFGRPFIKTELIHVQAEYGQIDFMIENSLNNEAKESFWEFISDRLILVRMVLDRIFLENQVHIYSARWEKTFDNISGAMAIIDKNFRVIRSNKNFREGIHSSVDSNQLLCYQIFAHRNKPCENCCLIKSLQIKESGTAQLDLDHHIYQMRAYPILQDKDSESIYAINQYIDITHSRELYLKMLQSEKVSSIGLLAGNIAHELNNPLTGIKSMAQVLKTQIESGSCNYGDLDEVEKGADRCLNIIKNLLEFSTGSGLKYQKIQLDDLVIKTLPMLKSVMRFFQSTVSLEAGGVFVLVEPHLIQQVIFNVVNNACQAMGDKGQIQILSHQIDDHWVELIISDTGGGIPLEIQDRIFEPFFSSNKGPLGTGLGLSLAKEIIVNYGGTISFRSQEGLGTEFFIRLPISRENF